MDKRIKEAYLGKARHNLKNPINAILGYSEMLIEDCEDDEPCLTCGTNNVCKKSGTACVECEVDSHCTIFYGGAKDKRKCDPSNNTCVGCTGEPTDCSPPEVCNLTKKICEEPVKKFTTKNNDPIYSQSQAKKECPARCASEFGTWTGGWWSTGGKSVCECK